MKMWKKLIVSKKSADPPPSPSPPPSPKKIKSWLPTGTRSFTRIKELLTAPQGYFTVHVGPENERFMLKMESVNHPLFKAFLDAAETEYGFTRDGPISLPCDVDLFYRVLAEMDYENSSRKDDENTRNIGCFTPLVHYSPAPACQPVDLAWCYSYGLSYRPLGSPRLVKINQ